MEKKMETTLVFWGYIGIMETNMETTAMGVYRVPSEHSPVSTGLRGLWISFSSRWPV